MHVRFSQARKLSVVIIAATALLALAGVAYAVGSSAITIKTTDAVSETSLNTNLSTAAKTPVTITSLSLPAGKWVISSTSSVVNFGRAPEFVRCQLVAGGGPIGGGTTMVGPGVNVAGVALAGALISSTAVTVSLQCAHDVATPEGAPIVYVDAGAVLVAHKAAVLNEATH